MLRKDTNYNKWCIYLWVYNQLSCTDCGDCLLHDCLRTFRFRWQKIFTANHNTITIYTTPQPVGL